MTIARFVAVVVVVVVDKVVFGFEAREVERPSGVKGSCFCVHGGCSRGG